MKEIIASCALSAVTWTLIRFIPERHMVRFYREFTVKLVLSGGLDNMDKRMSDRGAHPTDNSSVAEALAVLWLPKDMKVGLHRRVVDELKSLKG
jgi:hypothetical protein